MTYTYKKQSDADEVARNMARYLRRKRVETKTGWPHGSYDILTLTRKLNKTTTLEVDDRLMVAFPGLADIATEKRCI